ncbi:MAG: HlyD family secretion protein [Fulvimonas sp.]|nr:HlyD family secretion protein [Fulvimonas sp.]
MNPRLRKVLSVTLTVLVVAVALVVLRHLWQYYMRDPWTRDAHVGADVVQVAPDVSGFVTEVRVGDNAPVERGQVLFVIDQARYRIALAQALGALEQSQAHLAQSRAALLQSLASQRQLEREVNRDRALKDLVATEEIETRRANLDKANAAVAAAQASIGADEANIASAKAAVALARLNLERTVVHSPVAGRLNDRTVRLGDYVSAGRPVLAVLDTSSFRVDGYFEETRLHGIREGDRVDIHIMGEPGVLRGHVQSIAAGIEDRYRSTGASLLPNVNPAFDWVRLAQRVPVRIGIDQVPRSVRLIAGRTATVSIVPAGDGAPAATARVDRR